MSQSASIVSDPSTSVQSKPAILKILPDISPSTNRCSTHTQQQIDLLLLAIEALELGASEKMLATVKQLKLEEIVPSRVFLWHLRCSNPWRRSYTRELLSLDHAKVLVILVASRAKQLTVPIRQLLLAEQQMRSRNFPLENHYRLSEYLERFRAHFRSRMNSRRTKVALYLASEEQLNELALSLLKKLLFCTGTKGAERLWFSLFDGEIS
ncbi:Protein of unknown function (DUF3038) [Xenococcus sp. PCC 7305]|uniref:DUF3038 domain-containing protein n=1 Tax=Xenococcus sp. PCC 7305 TaxID=102125 RepID=UPI0002AC6EF7|nr:DUF3038 domain-containing protein [Xenococcus sp. PCC 7305]ELS04041.1 Protein of unknown function (DUF3038) [Xenococcus sp. PCC 7305]